LRGAEAGDLKVMVKTAKLIRLYFLRWITGVFLEIAGPEATTQAALEQIEHEISALEGGNRRK
jgi:hypothetical protein